VIKRDSIPCRYKQQGVTLIEILVTIVIVTIGLLGLAGLQARIQTAELESYQRVQAIILLQEMVDRLKANRNEAIQYATSGAALGTGTALDCAAPPASGYLRDLCDWSDTLKGASEVAGAAKLGAMIDARGCITNPVTVMPYEFVVSVAWQGLTPTAVPTVSTCGQGQYGTNDALRRVIATRVVFSCLQNQSDGVTCQATTP
jgi:type IV pilus assembly protein PilV